MQILTKNSDYLVDMGNGDFKQVTHSEIAKLLSGYTKTTKKKYTLSTLGKANKLISLYNYAARTGMYTNGKLTTVIGMILLKSKVTDAMMLVPSKDKTKLKELEK